MPRWKAPDWSFGHTGVRISTRWTSIRRGRNLPPSIASHMPRFLFLIPVLFVRSAENRINLCCWMPPVIQILLKRAWRSSGCFQTTLTDKSDALYPDCWFRRIEGLRAESRMIFGASRHLHIAVLWGAVGIG